MTQSKITSLPLQSRASLRDRIVETPDCGPAFRTSRRHIAAPATATPFLTSDLVTRYAPEPNTTGALCGRRGGAAKAHVNTSQSGSHGPSSLALRAANALARLRHWPRPQATSLATIATVAVAVLASVLPLMHEVLSHQSCSMLLSQPGAAWQLSTACQAQAGGQPESGIVQDLTRL